MKTLSIGTAALLLAFAGSASATSTFNFDNLKSNASGTTMNGFLPDGTKGVDYFVCTSGDACGFNPASGLGGALSYTVNTITVSATGTYNGQLAGAVQDHENGYNPSKRIGAGLGVYHTSPLDPSDDNITAFEMLTLTFNKIVNLSNITLRSEGHNVTWTPGATFQLNGVSTLLVDSFNPGLAAGKVFTFAFDDGNQTADQFYVAGVTANAVPLPAAALLFAPALLGFGALRRKQEGVA